MFFCLKNSFVLLCLFLISGCASNSDLYLKPALLHFDTPETSGKLLGGSMNFNITQKTPIYEYGKINNYYTIDTSEQVGSKNASNINMHLGLASYIDFIAFSPLSGIKIQLLGGSRQENTIGWKMAFSHTRGDPFESGRPNSSFDNTTHNIGGPSLKQTNKSMDYALNTGYRFNSSILGYLNVFYQKSESHGEISQGGLTILQRERTNKVTGSIFGVNYLNESKSISYLFELGLVKSRWPTLGTTTSSPFGFSVGFVW